MVTKQAAERPHITLFSPEDAIAMNQRELQPQQPHHPQQQHLHPPLAILNRASTGSSNVYRASTSALQLQRATARDNQSHNNQSLQFLRSSRTIYKGRESSDEGKVSNSRLSVSPDVNNAFEDMFETDWEGYLWKQGHVVRSWRYRYAVLSGLTFSYYLTKDHAMNDTEKYRGRVTVTGARKDDHRATGVQITTTINKVFCIYTRTPLEAEIWIRMIQQAVAIASGPKPSLCSNVLQGQSVRSSNDWINRNAATVKQFYNVWACHLVEQNNGLCVNQDEIALCASASASASTSACVALPGAAPTGATASQANATGNSAFFGLFPLCSMDMVLTIQYPCELFPASTFYGREGLVEVLLTLRKVVEFRSFTVTRYLNTKQPNVLQVLATGKLFNKKLQQEFSFASRDELHLSPGGRVVNLQMQMEVDPKAFEASDSDKKSCRNDKALQGLISKRVLSLSIQHFHVTRVLGKGTFGTVVLAERKNTGEIFAIKILEKSSMSNYDKLRTKTEMRILRDVHHPFIAPLRFSFQSQSRVFLGMEFYPGGSLYTHMNRFSNNKEHRVKIPLDLQRVRFYAAQIVLALSHLHACDIVYRDLKPDNIMIDEDGNIALVDFGLSKTSVGTLSGARTMAGSPAYTAPELLKPKRSRDYGKSVDWWCLGILIYEMLLAKRPFHHLNVSVLYKLIEKDSVKFPPKSAIPAEAKSLILGLLEKDPTKRLGAKQTSDILNHPFFRDTKWDQVLKKRVQAPWVPPAMAVEEAKTRGSDIDFDKFLASKTPPSGNFFNMLFSWKNHSVRAKRAATTYENDTFGKFSYVSDTTNSFLVDEDEMLDSAFTGRRSMQMQSLAGEA